MEPGLIFFLSQVSRSQMQDRDYGLEERLCLLNKVFGEKEISGPSFLILYRIRLNIAGSV